jgi:hypothetical protein
MTGSNDKPSDWSRQQIKPNSMISRSGHQIGSTEAAKRLTQ